MIHSHDNLMQHIPAELRVIAAAIVVQVAPVDCKMDEMLHVRFKT